VEDNFTKHKTNICSPKTLILSLFKLLRRSKERFHPRNWFILDRGDNLGVVSPRFR